MIKMKVKKGDKVLIIKGKDRGKSNKVIKVFPKRHRVIVDSLNMRKKTIRPKKEGESGQVVSVAWPIGMENVMVICHSCEKPTRIGSRIDGNKKVRYCKKCKTVI